MKRQSLALLLGSLCAVSAFATTYVRVEKDGTKTYSDRPIPGGQPIDLQPAQTYSAPAQTSGSQGSSREEELLRRTDDFRYESCSISPGNDETFQNPEAVAIAVSTSPGLREGDVVTLTVDGQPGQPNSMSYTMSPVYRGTHTVAVRVTNQNGQTVCSSSSAFHVQQVGLNSPARRPAAPPPSRPPRPTPPRPTPH
jgi:hypothetical protein